MIRGTEERTALPSLRQRISLELRRLILTGRLKAGQRIPQQRLAKQLSVSQSVIREALLEMQFTGLVESIDNLGIFVADVDTNKLLQAYDVREMLEGLAARLCCDTASISDLHELNDIASRVYELGVTGRDQARADLDRHFHDRLFEIPNNLALKRVAGAYHIVRMVVLNETPHEQVRDDHLRIIDAIRRNDADAAERFARQHVVAARQMIQRQISSNALAFGVPDTGESLLVSSIN